MSTINVTNVKGEAVGSIQVDNSIFESSSSPQVLQNAIVAHRANQRSGNHSTLTKGEVAGSGKKPWRQKGTGRARAGYKQSPIWRGGGVVFGPKPRDYSKGENRKSGYAALRLAVARRIHDGSLTVVDAIEVKEAKTREFTELLKAMKFDRGLVVVEKVTRELNLASRNVEGVEVTEARNLNSYQVMRHPRIVLTKNGLIALQMRIVATEVAK